MKTPKVEAGTGEWCVGAGRLKSQELAWENLCGPEDWGVGGSVWVPVSGRVASAFLGALGRSSRQE